jgi:hypothetical protein
VSLDWCVLCEPRREALDALVAELEASTQALHRIHAALVEGETDIARQVATARLAELPR